MSRTFSHCLVIGFLLFTLSGFLYAVARIEILPRPLTLLSYATMAPYQGYEAKNEELIAEGLISGSWEKIDLSPYFHEKRGERSMRARLWSFRTRGEAQTQEAYRGLAFRLLALEEQRGRSFTYLRLSLERWPMSPLGYQALRASEHLEREHVATVP